MRDVSIRGLVRELDAEELLDFITSNASKIPLLDLSYCFDQYLQLTGRQLSTADLPQQQQP